MDSTAIITPKKFLNLFRYAHTQIYLVIYKPKAERGAVAYGSMSTRPSMGHGQPRVYSLPPQ